MTIYDILQHPDSRLKKPARLVDHFNAELKEIIDMMFATHYAQKNCAALAASQLDIPDPPAITVIDFSEQKNDPLCLVNPEILDRHGETFTEEGCMSIKGIFEKIRRAEVIQVSARDRNGKLLEFKADGYLAKCIQHEWDHLQGTLMIDHLSRLKRQRIEKKIRKLQQER